MIAAGLVTVGGEVVRDPAFDVDADSGVVVNGIAVEPEPREIWMVNKPKNVVSTASEPGKRRAVVELVRSGHRLYPVGRLDADSTGLILVTNDGELANRLTHPRYEVPKTYRAKFRRRPSDEDIIRLRTGVELEDGPTLPAKVHRISPRTLELTLREGRNRQIRRMAEAIGNEVVELRRIAFGSLRLGELAEGASRRLSRTEIAQLWKDAGNE